MSKRRRIEDSSCNLFGVPTLRPDPATGLISRSSFLNAYNQHQAVYFPEIIKSTKRGEEGEGRTLFAYNDIADLFDSLSEKDKDSYCIENAAVEREEKEVKQGNFLRSRQSSLNVGNTSRRGYCSFLVQESAKLSSVLSKLPIVCLPIAASQTSKNSSLDDDGESETKMKGNDIELMAMRHGPCLWFFFGRNDPEGLPLEGRPEHTDSVSHDGTWHFQLSGVKEWHLRPTKDLMKLGAAKSGSIDTQPDAAHCVGNEGRVVIKCRKGDALIVNTRLWWHATSLPPQERSSRGGEAVPSVSYARDVYFSSKKDIENRGSQDDGVEMSNVDGLYAAENIDSATIVFTENDMPDCELHRSADPNCEVLQLEDGTGAVVSIKDIKAGEFFCIAESSDDDSSKEQEGDDFEEEGEEAVE